MEKNIGKTDSVIRIIVGLVALYLAFTYNYLWIIVTVLAFVTAFMKKCCLYSILHIKTNNSDKVVVKAKKKR